jgi:drug/metabolite transporter (DMT)-like permease
MTSIPGIIYVLIAALFYAIITITLVPFENITGWNEPEVLLFRYFPAGLIVLGFQLKKFLALSRIRILQLSFLGVIYIVCTICFYRGILEVGAAESTAILFTYPIYIFFFQWIAQKKANWAYFFIALLATAGCMLTVVTNQFSIEKVSFIVFLSSFFYSFYIWFSHKFQAGINHVDSSLVFLASSLVLFIFYFKEIDFNAPFNLSGVNWLYLTAIIIMTILSTSLFLKGTSMVGATKASIIIAFEPGITTILALLFLSASFSWLQIFGIGMIIVANILLSKIDV